MVNQIGHFFCTAPRSANQAIDIGSEHCKGVIDDKNGVSFDLFELTLTCNAAFMTLELLVNSSWKMAFDNTFIKSTFIRFKMNILG